jgi:hypothetical protein
MVEVKDDCPKCHGKRRIQDKDGTVHLCFDCLANGKLDMHDKTFLDHNIRL